MSLRLRSDGWPTRGGLDETVRTASDWSGPLRHRAPDCPGSPHGTARGALHPEKSRTSASASRQRPASSAPSAHAVSRFPLGIQRKSPLRTLSLSDDQNSPDIQLRIFLPGYGYNRLDRSSKWSALHRCSDSLISTPATFDLRRLNCTHRHQVLQRDACPRS